MITADSVKKLMVTAGINVDIGTIVNDVPLRDLGFDSLDVYNLLSELQEYTSIDVPESEINNLQSVNDFVDYFSKQASGV